MHRFTWDLRYPGPWMSAARPEGPNGPAAVPGKFSLRLTVGSWSSTEPLTVVEDSRVTKDGVTTTDLREQFDHNVRVRELVSDMNRTLARLRAAQASLRGATGAAGEKLAKLNQLAARLITNAPRRVGAGRPRDTPIDHSSGETSFNAGASVRRFAWILPSCWNVEIVPLPSRSPFASAVIVSLLFEEPTT